MPPARTGYVEPLKHADGSTYYRARVRLADGSRERVDVPDNYAVPAGGKTARERAELYAMAAQEREDETGELLAKKRAREAEKAAQRDPRHGETCTMYRERLDAYRKELGRRGGDDDASMWKVWIADRIGHRPIAKVTRDEVESIRDALDEAIARHKKTDGAEGIGAKRARNVWTVVTTTFKWRSAATCACARTTRAPASFRPSAASHAGGHSSTPSRRRSCWLAPRCPWSGARSTPSPATCTCAPASSAP